MIYRLLLDQALTVRSTPVLSFAPSWCAAAKRKLATKNEVKPVCSPINHHLYIN